MNILNVFASLLHITQLSLGFIVGRHCTVVLLFISG